jgi:hypothetical protein
VVGLVKLVAQFITDSIRVGFFKYESEKPPPAIGSPLAHIGFSPNLGIVLVKSAAIDWLVESRALAVAAPQAIVEYPMKSKLFPAAKYPEYWRET